ncbi:MAG: Snf7 family protein, partial [Candidatus Bathyarchaeia archaeon]
MSSSGFVKKWVDDDKRGIKEIIRPQTPLKAKINLAIRRVELQVQRLNESANRLAERDKSLFEKIVKAYTEHDIQRANVFANELAEIRKMEKFMMHSSLALERVILRLRTVSELGDIAVTLAPATSVLQSIQKGISGIMPTAERELGEVGDLLNEIIVEAQGTGMTLNFESVNEDARKILEEAAIVAEQKMKEKFPELPTGLIPTTKVS